MFPASTPPPNSVASGSEIQHADNYNVSIQTMLHNLWADVCKGKTAGMDWASIFNLSDSTLLQCLCQVGFRSERGRGAVCSEWVALPTSFYNKERNNKENLLRVILAPTAPAFSTNQSDM